MRRPSQQRNEIPALVSPWFWGGGQAVAGGGSPPAEGKHGSGGAGHLDVALSSVSHGDAAAESEEEALPLGPSGSQDPAGPLCPRGRQPH